MVSQASQPRWLPVVKNKVDSHQAEARGQGLAANGRRRIPAPRSRGRGQAAAVGAEPEDELSKFRELWQGPAERLEELLELLRDQQASGCAEQR